MQRLGALGEALAAAYSCVRSEVQSGALPPKVGGGYGQGDWGANKREAGREQGSGGALQPHVRGRRVLAGEWQGDWDVVEGRVVEGCCSEMWAGRRRVDVQRVAFVWNEERGERCRSIGGRGCMSTAGSMGGFEVAGAGACLPQRVGLGSATR